MQTKMELEQWYSITDPWGYRNNPHDNVRKFNISKMLLDTNYQYQRAIDIGCGEGYITSGLPALELHGMDLSNNALNRLPENVKPVAAPEGKYDLVVSTGTLYSQYDHESIAKLIRDCATKHVLIGGIKEWLLNYSFGKVIAEIQFPYREYIQKLTLYEISA